MRYRFTGAALAVAACLPSPAFACASCGCTLTSDWLAQGLVVTPGTTIGLRYDYIPQTQLRAGTGRVDAADQALPNDREIERYTYNHYVTASIDRQFSSDWGVNVQVPFVYRPHSTVGEDETDPSYSHTGGLGDVRVTGRYQWLSGTKAIEGVQFGLQLPTGRFRQDFRSGPETGEAVDRGLQPGTGTVQAVLGYYRTGRLGGGFDYIVQTQGMVPLDRRDEYRPGATGQLSAALHWTKWRGIVPQLQLNARVTARDRGANADTENSGGEQLYAAPGAIVPLGGGMSAFAYVQVPLYQRLGGYQLAPKAAFTFGVQRRL